MDTNTHPATLAEAVRAYADPAVANAAMAAMRWPEGIVCPRCGGREHYAIKTRHAWQCKACKRQFTVKVGSIMEDSPIAVGDWLVAMWLMVNARNGISSYEIARSVGVTQKSAWFMAHRIRHAMMAGSLDKLDGEVEIDQTFIGPDKRKMNAESRERFEAIPAGRERVIVQTVVERGGDVRSRVIRDTSRSTIHDGIRAVVEPGAKLYTDEHASYDRLDGYERESVNHGEGQYRDGEAYTNTVEGTFNLFKRCVRGTWVAISPTHAGRYLAEQDTRYNVRKLKDGQRAAIVGGMVGGRRMTYAKLTARRGGRGPQKGYDWRRGY